MAHDPILEALTLFAALTLGGLLSSITWIGVNAAIRWWRRA